jgi:hypothetical protein
MSSPEDASSSLVHFSAELLAAVTSYLPNRAIKNLRLACRVLRDRVALRLDRVFLSANPRNVEVLHAVADHETFRHRVFEIIWDDALLVDHIPGPHDHLLRPGESRLPWELAPPEGCPGWFHRACQQNIDDLKRIKRTDHPDTVMVKQKMEAQLPPHVAWDCYQELLLRQDEVLASGADIEALRYGLKRFPALRRVTITPAAHGMLFVPLYETPMIRAFPDGFNYPLPRGWPTPERGDHPYYVRRWDDEREKSKWRGFCIVVRELANAEQHRGVDQHRGVTELVLDVHYLNTGLNCHLFDQPNEDYDNLVTVLQRPNFSRIDLVLLAEGQQNKGWPSFRSSYLKRALGKATDLQHFSLQSQIDQGQFYEDLEEHFVSLTTLFPVEKWQKLRHFGLSNFLVKQDDLLSMLASLPKSIRSVELGFLFFLDESNYKSLLDAMRETLGWRHRPVKPVVTILCVNYANKLPWRYIWMRDAVNDFLYSDATNPFGNMVMDGNRPDLGRGAIVRDPFLPALDEPHEPK